MRNEYGTPLLDNIWESVERCAAFDTLCYVNSDIILMSDFLQAVQRVTTPGRRFLMGGRRWDTPVTEPLDFEGDWETPLRAQVAREGRQDPPGSVDYFVFQRGLWNQVPPFAIGRFYWDSWLLYKARHQGVPLIDATEVIMPVHQRHDYSHTSVTSGRIQDGPEALHNIEIAGGRHHLYTLSVATHRLTPQGLVRRPPGRWLVEHAQTWWNGHSRIALHRLQGASGPDSYFGYPARALLWLFHASTPTRQRLGRAVTAWKEAHS